jgi:predicted HTH transcriptional regulator
LKPKRFIPKFQKKKQTFDNIEPLDSEKISSEEDNVHEEYKEEKPKKKRIRRKANGPPKERIVNHLSKIKKPSTWKNIRETVPGDKSTIWKYLNELVSENVILQTGEGKRGSPYFFQLNNVDSKENLDFENFSKRKTCK